MAAPVSPAKPTPAEHVTKARRRTTKAEHKRGGARPGAGRPTKRSQGVEEILLEGVEIGLSIARAAALAGITSETYQAWCEKDAELERRVEAARARGIRRALEQLHRLKADGDSRSITWFLEKMDRENFGPQPAVIAAAQQNNYLLNRPTKDQVDEISQFISEQRRRMALARSLRLSDPEKAAEIEAVTLDVDDTGEIDG